MAKVGKFKVRTYGDGKDKIKGKQLKAVFGQEGNDILTGISQDYNKPTLLSGGSGNDTYRLRGDFNIIIERWVTAWEINFGLKLINYCPGLTHPAKNIKVLAI